MENTNGYIMATEVRSAPRIDPIEEKLNNLLKTLLFFINETKAVIENIQESLKYNYRSRFNSKTSGQSPICVSITKNFTQLHMFIFRGNQRN